MTKMYHFCLLEPALFRFLHDAPRSELLIDLPLNFFYDSSRTSRVGGGILQPPEQSGGGAGIMEDKDRRNSGCFLTGTGWNLTSEVVVRL